MKSKKNIESNQTIDFDIKDALAVQNYMAKNNPLFKDLTDSIKARIFLQGDKIVRLSVSTSTSSQDINSGSKTGNRRCQWR
jgi:hypothetical protein